MLKLRVRAVPENGKANLAVIDLLAKTLDLPRSGLSITQGATNRIKTVFLPGNIDDLTLLLAALPA